MLKKRDDKKKRLKRKDSDLRQKRLSENAKRNKKRRDSD